MPLLQKQIILRCLEAGKPVITATQMLESMVEHAEPTRAEASDVANAILDGTSAVMLSAETAVGALPGRGGADDGLHRARGRAVDGATATSCPRRAASTDVRRAMSNAATDLAEALGAKAILVATATGRTASEIARLRPRRPMIGLSHHQTAVQQMALEWGVLPLADAVDRPTSRISGSARSRRRARPGSSTPGDLVVLDRRHRGQPLRLDERDQGRRRLGTATRAGRTARAGRGAKTSRAMRARARLRLVLAARLRRSIARLGAPLLEAAPHATMHTRDVLQPPARPR